MDSAASIKNAILACALPHISFDGWTSEVLRRAARECGVDAGVAELYFPRGGIDAIVWHSQQGDAQMAEAVAALPLAEMKIPQKVKAAMMLRLREQQPHRESIRKALGILSFPTHAAESLTLLYATVDTIWKAIGDVSTDFNWYTKRLTLAGVYSSTLLFWLNDESENLAETEAFLGRRLKNVYQLGQWRKRSEEAVSHVAAPFFRMFGK